MTRAKGDENLKVFRRYIEILAVLPIHPEALTAAAVSKRLAGESFVINERGGRSRNRQSERIAASLDALVPMFGLYRSSPAKGRLRYAWMSSAADARHAAVLLRGALPG